jgi:hypothetical protein
MIEFLSFSRPERPDRLSMVVDYLNVCRVSPMPYKTDSILLVDSNAVLSETVALQSLKIVAARSRKIAQLPCRVQCFQFPSRGALDMPQRRHVFPFEESFCAGIAKALDHEAV